MRLSSLQKYILTAAREAKGKFGRERLMKFYADQSDGPSRKEQMDAVTKALERMIDRELMTGYGVRTPHKWYIKEIKLTPKGRKTAKNLLGEQMKLKIVN